jgi:hypothetical protein
MYEVVCFWLESGTRKETWPSVTVTPSWHFERSLTFRLLSFLHLSTKSLTLEKTLLAERRRGEKQAAKTTFNWILNICSRKTFKRWGRRREAVRAVCVGLHHGRPVLSVSWVGRQIILTSSGANWLSADRIQLVAFMILCEGFVYAGTHARCCHRQRNIFLVLVSKIKLTNCHPVQTYDWVEAHIHALPKPGNDTSLRYLTSFLSFFFRSSFFHFFDFFPYIFFAFFFPGFSSFFKNPKKM